MWCYLSSKRYVITARQGNCCILLVYMASFNDKHESPKAIEYIVEDKLPSIYTHS